MAGEEREKENDNSGTIRLAGAVSILLACALGYWLNPFGSPYTSAGILGFIAALSFAARGLFSKKK